MELTELGFDYSNLVSCTVKKKNNIVPLIMFIVGIVFIIKISTKKHPKH